MSLLSIDIARLIHHHLLKEGYENTANSLINECIHLKGLKPVKFPYKLPRLLGPSLVDLLESYFETKDSVIEELELLKSAVFREQDCLSTLAKILFENLKSSKIETPSQQISKCFRDASFNTDEDSAFKNCSKCFSGEITKKTSDACVNTEFVLTDHDQNSVSSTMCQFQKDFCDDQDTSNVIRTQICNSLGARLETEDTLKVNSVVSVNTTELDNAENLCESSKDPVDFTLVYERLLENREFQEKIADSINKKKAEVSLLYSKPSDNISSTPNLDLNSIVKAIVSETQADPAFDCFLKDCLGIESRDQTLVGTPDNTAVTDIELSCSPMPSVNLEVQSNPTDVENLALVPIAVPQTSSPCHRTNATTNQLNSLSSLTSVAIVNASGQITLVPTIVSAAPIDGAKVLKKNKPKVYQQPASRKPVAIAPKPLFTLTIPSSTGSFPQICPIEESTINQSGLELIECKLNNKTDEMGNEIVLASSMKQISKSTGGFSKAKTAMKIRHRPLSKRPRKKLRPDSKILFKPANPSSSSCCNAPTSQTPLQVTPAMAELMKIAQEACKTLNISQSEEVTDQFPSSPEGIVSSGTPLHNPSEFVTTPTSTRRRSHIRQLNFGDATEISGIKSYPRDEATEEALVTKRSETPWDCALRNGIAAIPSSKESVFPAPNGKAKRARRHSMESKTNGFPLPQDTRVLEDAGRSNSRSDEIVGDVTSMGRPSTTQNAERLEASRVGSLTSSDYTDLVTASILTEMATSAFRIAASENEVNEVEERSGTRTVSDPVQVGLPVLATPQKEITHNSQPSNLHSSCQEGQSSSSFGVWDGEIPRTPQIRFDLTNSTSPFQISLTKGFRFLPAADSPSLAAPSTPCITGAMNSSNSIDTPYNVMYQFPSVLNTPRLEALRNDKLESPGKDLNTTMISPTQVILGRATPYFVPSGERIQRPFVNDICTPEHIPETVKFDRIRHSSSEMDPLQLEESMDACDLPGVTAHKSVSCVGSTLQPSGQLNHQCENQLSLPNESDETLEDNLINECRRLEEVPATRTGKSRDQRLIDLFGDDSSSSNGTLRAESRAPKTIPNVASYRSSNKHKSRPEKKRKKM